MPIAKIQLPDGRIAKFEVPEGTTEEQVMSFVREQGIGQESAQTAQPPQEAAAPQTVADVVAGAQPDQGKFAQMMQTPAAPAIAAGFGTAVTEAGQALSDWIAKGLDYVGAKGPAEAVGDFSNNLQEREQNIVAGAQQLTKDWYESLYGAPVDEKQIEKDVQQGAKVADFGAKIGAGFAGGAATLGAKTFKGAAAIGSLEGLVSGALLGNADQGGWEARVADRMGEATVGGLLGLATGSISGVFTSARNFLANNVSKHAKQADESFRLGDQFDVNLTFGQASGNPTIQNIESQAQADIAQKFFAQQANEAGMRIGQRIGVNVKPLDQVGAGTGKALRDTEQAVKLAVTKMKVARNEAWRNQINAAKSVAGDAPLYKPHDFVAAMRDVESDVIETFGNKVPLSRDMETMIEEMETAAAGAGINANQVNKWWKRVNEWKSSGFGVFDSGIPGVKEGQYKNIQQVFAGKLASALDRSIETAQTTALGPQRDALELLRGARQNYKKASGEIRAIENDFLSALGMQGTPRQVMEKLSRVDPEISRTVVNHVRKLDGGEQYIAQLRDAVFDSAHHAGMQAAVRTGAQKGDVDLAAFADALADGTRRSVLAGISPPAMEARAKEGVSILRKMLNESAHAMPGGVMQRQLPVNFQDVAINAISRNPGFMARLFAGSIARGHNMESLFFTPEGIRVLRSFRPEVVKYKALSGTRNAGVAFLSNQIGDDAKNETDAKFRERMNAMSMRSATQ